MIYKLFGSFKSSIFKSTSPSGSLHTLSEYIFFFNLFLYVSSACVPIPNTIHDIHSYRGVGAHQSRSGGVGFRII